MELKVLIRKIEKLYEEHINRLEIKFATPTKSFFEVYPNLIEYDLSVFGKNDNDDKKKYLSTIRRLIYFEQLRCKENTYAKMQIRLESIEYSNLTVKEFEELKQPFCVWIMESEEYHNSLFNKFRKVEKAIEEGKQEAPERQEAPDKPQEQAKEAPKGKATAKVKGRSKTDILRIYQAMERAGFIEEFPTYERLIELHFEGDETNDISGLLSSKAGTERVQSTAKYHKFIMALITMAFNNENIKHLDKLRNEIDDYIDKLETTYSKHS